MIVGWKVSTQNLNVASVRYRALLPALALKKQRIKSRFFHKNPERNLRGLDALVLVKSTHFKDYVFAQQAAMHGIPIILDLCDHIFVPGYTNNTLTPPGTIFASLASLAQAIVVTTEPLAAQVKAHLGNHRPPVYIIPDGAKPRHWPLSLHLRTAGSGILKRFQKPAAPRPPAPWHKHLYRFGRACLEPIRPIPTPTRHRLLWFGNHGADYAKFGLLDLLIIKDDLERIAREFDVELIVVSNHKHKYLENIQPLAINSRYFEWSERTVSRLLKTSPLVLIPNSRDDFSLCKSANRAVLALQAGAPVVATRTIALEPLADCIRFDDFYHGIKAYLSSPELIQDDTRHARDLITREFGPARIAGLWTQVLREVSRNPPPAPHLLTLLNLIQDLYLILPILLECQRQQIPTLTYCSGKLLNSSPRVLKALREHGLPFWIIDSVKELPPLPASAKALLTAAETSLGAHKLAHELTLHANRQGLYTVTLQHGFENVGLTYDDAVHPIGTITFAAQSIFTWGPPGLLHPLISDHARRKCIVTGITKFPRATDDLPAGLLPPGDHLIGVFENLHWHRYSEAYKAFFIEGIIQSARQFPQLTFIVKPHHAGLWLSSHSHGALPANVIVINPAVPPWENFTASALLPRVRAVFTTPSTVALDAARLGLPVAIISADLDLPAYQPLPLITQPDDWTGFLRALETPETHRALADQSQRFVTRTLAPLDGVQEIVRHLALATNTPAAVA